jgi:hypothetical protein
MMRNLSSVLFLPLLLGAAPALAQTTPPSIVPQHDVSGTYLVTSPTKGPQTFSVEYSKAANSARFNPPGGEGYMLYDFTAHDGKMVMPQMQRYMDMPSMAAREEELGGGAGGGTTGGTHDNVTVTEIGTKTIAGHDCTNYKATDTTKGTWSTLCVTSDGVLLELISDKGDTVEAQSVSYDPVPEADLQVPAGYTEFVMPQMPGMSGMGGMPPGAGGMSGMSGMPGMSPPAQ